MNDFKKGLMIMLGVLAGIAIFGFVSGLIKSA